MKVHRIAARLCLALAACLAPRPQPAGADVLRNGYTTVREGNADNAMLGYSVATAGDVNGDGYSDVLLNGPQGNGMVWCYHAAVGPGGTLEFTEEWSLTGAPNALLNSRVSPAGDVNGDGYDDVLIGAPLYWNGEFNEGAVFVYLGSASGLSPTTQRFIEGNIVGAALGAYLDTAGDVNGDGYDDIVIGSPTYANGESGEGRALVYLGSAAGIADAPAWSFESNIAQANFGRRVAGTGDVNADGYDDILVSAPELANGQNGEGRVYLFLGSSTGPALAPSWTYESNIIGGRAGWGLGCAGDANGDGYADMVFDVGTNNPAFGAVHVFFGGPTGPGAGPDRSYPSGSGAFGDMVYTAGDINGDGFSDLVVGDMSAVAQTGKIAILGGVETGSLFPLLAERYGTQTGEQFAADCRSAGDVNGDGFGDVIVGAPGYDNGNTNEGAVRVYLGRAGAPNLSAAWSPQGAEALSEYGAAVAQGDWNGDGYTDLAVGSPDHDAGATNTGSVSVYYGGFFGYATGASWFMPGAQPSGHFGSALANAGDIDNDGYDELIVGEPYYRTFDYPDIGAVHLFKGSINGLGTTPWWYQTGGIQPATFGYAVAGAGDVNGDGYADVVIGAPNHEFAPFERGGAAYLYLGSAGGLNANAVWSGFGGATGDGFGTSAAGVGDLNADGFGDIVVGAPRKESGPSLVDEGYAFFLFGSPTGISNMWTQTGDQAGALYGMTVAAGGDFLGDGHSDALVGAPFYDPDGINDGGIVDAYVGTETFDVGWARRWQGTSPGAKMGSAVAGGGDVNGDGWSDIAIGAAGDDYGYPDGGAVYVYTCVPFGYCDGPDVPVWVNWGTQSGGQFGQALSMAGDGTADGFADLIVGQPVYQNRLGRAYCFYGAREGMPAGEDGCKRLPIQRRNSGMWIRPLGASDIADGFTIHTLARSARGRSTLEVQYQINEPGNWIGSPMSAGSFDTGDPNGPWGSTYSAFVTASGLDAGTAYRWRMRAVGDSPYFPLTPWFSVAGNAPGETDVRTAPAGTGVAGPGGDGADGAATPFVSRVGPNPCRDEATVWFTMPAVGAARLTVHDVTGRRVATLVDRVLGAGAQTASWDTRDAAGRRVAAGVYMLRLERGAERSATKLIVQR